LVFWNSSNALILAAIYHAHRQTALTELSDDFPAMTVAEVYVGGEKV
jgi:hypothetical protein